MCKTNTSNDSRRIPVGAIDLIRCLEQTAMVTSLLVGRRGLVNVPTVPKIANASMFGYLRRFSAQTGTRVLVRGVDAGHEKTINSIIGPFEREMREIAEPSATLEIVPAAIDGKRDLLEGLDGGSVSVLGVGAEGTFEDSRHADESDYLVIVLADVQRPGQNEGREPKTTLQSLSRAIEATSELGSYDGTAPQNSWNLGPDRKAKSPRGADDDRWMPINQFLSEVGASETLREAFTPSSDAGLDFVAPTIGVLAQQANTLRRVFHRDFRVHNFSGGSTAAAAAIMLRETGVRAFLGIVRGVQTTLIAAMAKATGSGFLAIPVHTRMIEMTPEPDTYKLDDKGKPKQKRPKKLDTPSVVLKGNEKHIRPRGIDHFIKGSDFFVLMTGITENRIVRGVRFYNEMATGRSTAKLETLHFCGQTTAHRTTRFLHALNETWIADTVGAPYNAKSFLLAVDRLLRQDAPTDDVLLAERRAKRPEDPIDAQRDAEAASQRKLSSVPLSAVAHLLNDPRRRFDHFATKGFSAGAEEQRS